MGGPRGSGPASYPRPVVESELATRGGVVDPVVNQAGRRYRVLEPVGRGSFGTVYRAELLSDGGFAKMVALKILNSDVDDAGEVATRLRDEARVLGLIRHRAIVQVDGLVRLEGRWAVVMEYVEGLDLRRLLAATGKMPVSAALELTGEVASALHVAYNGVGPDRKALRLLHRDIKPSNIQVTRHGETKVLDFGVARADFESREAETRSLVFGSMGYMAPERLDLIDGPEGDIYGLGSVLFETLTAKRFGKTSAKESRHRTRLLEALDAVWEATDGKSEDVVRLVESMMAYEPSERPIARDVERRCAEIRRDLGGELFPDWCERVVQPAVAIERARAKAEHTSVGAVLSEESASGPRRPVAQPVDAPNEGRVFLQEDTLDAPGSQPAEHTDAGQASTIDFRARSRAWLVLVGACVLAILVTLLLGLALG
jgi:serine/threonine protein kinase